MNKEQEISSFRMAAILYADSNDYQVSRKSVVTKIIEDALMNFSKTEIDTTSLIKTIEEKYELLFTEDEIKSTISHKNNDNKFISSVDASGNMMVSLSPNRRLLLEQSKRKTLKDYVNDFLKINNYTTEEGECILKFLHEYFTSSVSDFKKLLSEKHIKEAELTRYEQDERIRINKFLEWENEDKDKAIFEFASYALEFCMLTNSSKSQPNQECIQNKVFYLDTNIIYRVLGLNGDDLQEKTKKCLDKFIEAKEILKITMVTNKEFRESLEANIKKIKRNERPRCNYSVITEWQEECSLQRTYHIWKTKNYNGTLELFQAEILSKYDEMKRQYKIDIDGEQPFEITKQARKIEDYISGIKQCNTRKDAKSAELDAKNALWVENKRENLRLSLSETKYYLLTQDSTLTYWDKSRDLESLPLAVLPTSWLSIILKYVGRTKDDFKSFVSFLSLSVNDKVVPDSILMPVLNGIECITQKESEQKEIVKNFIENHSIENLRNMTPEEIEIESKVYAESELSKKINELENSTKEQGEEIAKQGKRIEDLENEKQSAQGKIKDKDDEIKELKEKLLKSQKRSYYIKWGICATICFALIFFCFFFQEWTYNPATKISNFMDERLTGTLHAIADYIIVLPFGLFGTSIYKLFKSNKEFTE